MEESVYGQKTILSSRANLSSAEVFAFYRDGMTALGWSLQTPEPETGAPSFEAVFTKGTDKITVLFYASENYSGQVAIPAGSRIQIIYKG